MRVLACELREQSQAILDAFAHADDPARANGHATPSYALQRVQPFLVGARRDDPAVELGARVKVVIVCRQACLGQPVCLLLIEHAKRATRLHPQGPDATNHLDNPFEFVTFGGFAPRRAHAEACSALGLRLSRLVKRVFDTQEGLALDAGLVMRGLRAIGAVFRAVAGLDAQERAALDGTGVVMCPMDGLGAVEQIGEGKVVNLTDLVARPVVTDHLAPLSNVAVDEWRRRRDVLAPHRAALARIYRLRNRLASRCGRSTEAV